MVVLGPIAAAIEVGFVRRPLSTWEQQWEAIPLTDGFFQMAHGFHTVGGAGIPSRRRRPPLVSGST